MAPNCLSKGANAEVLCFQIGNLTPSDQVR